MRLFVETDDVVKLMKELVTWVPVESCDDVLLYGTKTKGLIVENCQLNTEFPNNTHEFGNRKWTFAESVKLAPCFIREPEVQKASETLNTSIIFVCILVLIWVIFLW